MICNNCNKEVQEDALFCPYCGSAIKSEEKPAQDAIPESQSADNNQEAALSPDVPADDNAVRTDVKVKTLNSSKTGCRLRTVLYIFLLFVLSVCLLASVTLRGVLNENTVNNSIKQIDFAELDIKAITENKFESIPQMVARSANDKRITVKAASNIIEKMDYEDLIDDYVANIRSYILDGKKLRPLEASQISEAVKQNEKLIYIETGIRLSQNDYRALEKECSKYLKDFNQTVEQAIGADSQLRPVLIWLQPIISVPGIIILSILIAGIAALYIIDYIRRRMSVPMALLGMGVTLSIASAPFAAAGIILRSSLDSLIPQQFAELSPMLYPFADSIISTGVIAFALGILLTASGIVFCIIKRKKTSGKQNA